jgi:Xaa-Pro dipeptidase
MEDSYEILRNKYPAKEHAKRVAKYLESTHGILEGVIYLEGQKSRLNEDSDSEAPFRYRENMPSQTRPPGSLIFRQRRYFYYLSGCPLPGCSLVYDMASSVLTLFIPPIDPDSVIWSGLPLSAPEALASYDVDEARLSTELNDYLSHMGQQSSIFAIRGQVSDHISFPPGHKIDMALVKEAIEECRVVKDAYEVALIRKANSVTQKAHTAVLRAASSAENERQLYALFLQTCISHGCAEQAYHGIFASGTNAATLHYHRNDEPLAARQNLLVDAAGEYQCYAADVTRTFPINGRFTNESRAIYGVVLKMQKECLRGLKANALWDDVHAQAHRIAISGLLGLGILRGGTPEEIFDARTSVAFFPHGLGHYLGLEVHDTGGDANYADKDPMYRYLRVRGRLPAGAVITVEPGIYFCRFIIEPYLNDAIHGKYIDQEVLGRYWEVGGVRIEGTLPHPNPKRLMMPLTHKGQMTC